MNHIEIKSGIEQMDIVAIHHFLSHDSYWAKGISFELVKASLENSFCMGAFLDGRQVGFGRVITDYHTFGWLADVYVLPEYRGRGISKEMMRFMTEQPWVGKLRRLMLNTLDAHELYRGYGFNNLTNPVMLMEVYRPDVHLAKSSS
ncbi:GNAT family N-acetyltransferase [Chitinophaga qingshengii]|uniref:GNAT family N-acetyltransferase n=2 Tax=Chitinophaga qingshengii TaxID=1569794 RepID=A0ABR7TRW2_9BACT|nr:GNAT family N-acetyltransferase [Chitinophaga qingshengii]